MADRYSDSVKGLKLPVKKGIRVTFENVIKGERHESGYWETQEDGKEIREHGVLRQRIARD